MTDSLGNLIEGEPIVGPRGPDFKRDSFSFDARLVNLLLAGMNENGPVKHHGPFMSCTDDLDSIGSPQDNVVQIGPRGKYLPRDTRRS